MANILFVCSSNRSRGPLAAAYFQHLAIVTGINDLSVYSVGIRTRAKELICPEVEQLLAEYNLKPQQVGTTQLLPKMLKGADLILCMTSDQQEYLEKKFISARHKTKTLMGILKLEKDIFDPCNEGLDRFRQCLEMMKPALQTLAERLH